jgi:hypothetical protein
MLGKTPKYKGEESRRKVLVTWVGLSRGGKVGETMWPG